MATKARALVGFSDMKDDELVVAANTIIGAMTDNEHYPAPTPTLQEVQDLLDDFTAKLAASRRRGSPQDTAVKDEAKPVLAAALQRLGYNVNSVAQGRLSVLLSSGFPTSATVSGQTFVPPQVEGVRAGDGRQSLSTVSTGVRFIVEQIDGKVIEYLQLNE